MKQIPYFTLNLYSSVTIIAKNCIIFLLNSTVPSLCLREKITGLIFIDTNSVLLLNVNYFLKVRHDSAGFLHIYIFLHISRVKICKCKLHLADLYKEYLFKIFKLNTESNISASIVCTLKFCLVKILY